MAKKNEKTPLKKGEARFMLIGEAKVNDYTYKIDELAQESDWVYNVLNLGVDCGENGVIYSELMGGYGSERENKIYVHGVKEGKNGRKQDDFDNRFEIDWDDRFDDSVLEEVGELCFITVGLEKDKKGKTFVKKFLSAYDAILYVQEQLESGMVINVKGSLKYSKYNDNYQTKKEITSIFLSKVEDRNDYRATFTQTILLDKDSIGKPDKDKGIIPIYAYVVDYVKNYGDKEVKTNIPYPKMFELEIGTEEQTKKWLDKVLKVKKGITEITFEGDLIEGGALVTVTEDDIPDDIKELIEIGAYTVEEALTKCSANNSKEKRMIIRKPAIKMQGEEGKEVPVVQKFEEKYTEDDLVLDFMLEDNSKDDDDNDDDGEPPFDVDDENEAEEKASNDTSWLDKL